MNLLSRILSISLGVTLIFALYQAQRASTWEAAYHRLDMVTRAASVRATADQIATNHQPAAISAAIAKVSDVQDPIQAARVRAAVADYARAHPAGCVWSTPSGGFSKANLPGANRPAQSGGGADLPPDMVAITGADLDGFAANTRDLDTLRAYLAALIAQGVAKQPPP